MKLEQIAFGQCRCGQYGQLFRSGKCAHCHIAGLERLIRYARVAVLAALLALLVPAGAAHAGKTVEMANVTITAAVTGVVEGDQELGLGAVRSLTIQANFTYGSGGLTAKAWLQTTFDNGATWVDIASFAFTTATARRLYHLTNVAVTAIATPSDGTLADNTAVNGFLGERFRVKLTTTGTYAGGTTLVILVQAE